MSSTCIQKNNNNKNIYISDLEVAHPQSGSSSTDSWSNWNLEMLVFEGRGKPEYPEKNLSRQRREQYTVQPRFNEGPMG